MNIYSDKLAHVQIVINCRDSIAQICTYEETLAHNLGVLYLDDVMSYNSLTTLSFHVVALAEVCGPSCGCPFNVVLLPS